MSQTSKKKKAVSAPRKERIIPIQIEGEEESMVTSTTSNKTTPARCTRQNSNKHEEHSAKQIVEKENDISEDSISGDESNVEKVDTVTDVPQRTLPTCNVPEKIIIVLDTANDENSTNFEMTSGKTYTPLVMLRNALQLFVYNKSFIDNRHEFAVMSLTENSATWIHDFTNAPQDIIAAVESLTEFPCDPEDIFDLNSIFDIINKKITLSPPNKEPTIPPTEVFRAILLYGRSYSIPHLTRTNEIEKLLNSPYFTVDVVMTHESPDTANHCDRIFNELQEIDSKGFAYSFSVSRNAAELHSAMAKILSHPLQRPNQLTAKYDLGSYI